MRIYGELAGENADEGIVSKKIHGHFKSRHGSVCIPDCYNKSNGVHSGLCLIFTRDQN